MAKAKPKTKADRVGAGSALACVTTLLVYGLWRIAVTYDATYVSGAGDEAWIWLMFEVFVLAFSFPFYAGFACGLGAMLVHWGSGARYQAVIGSMALAALYGCALYSMGLFDMLDLGFLATAPVSIGVLAIAGAAAGYVGHFGWYPYGRKTD